MWQWAFYPHLRFDFGIIFDSYSYSKTVLYASILYSIVIGKHFACSRRHAWKSQHSIAVFNLFNRKVNLSVMFPTSLVVAIAIIFGNRTPKNYHTIKKKNTLLGQWDCRKSSWYIFNNINGWHLYSCTAGQPIFTEEPPRTLYVVSGGNAIFNWKYFVHDRESTFDIWSPKWSFYDENGTEHVIGSDFKFDSWNWRNLTSCPQRLLRPTIRVSRKENATLVITNVTTADSGMYGCALVLKSPPPVKSDKVHLVVTGNINSASPFDYL